MSGHAADFDHRRGTGKSQHHRHLQEQAEEIADIVRRMLGKAFGAIAALNQECLTVRHFGQGALQFAGFTGKNQRRKSGKLRLDSIERIRIGIGRDLLDRL